MLWLFFFFFCFSKKKREESISCTLHCLSVKKTCTLIFLSKLLEEIRICLRFCNPATWHKSLCRSPHSCVSSAITAWFLLHSQCRNLFTTILQRWYINWKITSCRWGRNAHWIGGERKKKDSREVLTFVKGRGVTQSAALGCSHLPLLVHTHAWSLSSQEAPCNVLILKVWRYFAWATMGTYFWLQWPFFPLNLCHNLERLG